MKSPFLVTSFFIANRKINDIRKILSMCDIENLLNRRWHKMLYDDDEDIDLGEFLDDNETFGIFDDNE